MGFSAKTGVSTTNKTTRERLRTHLLVVAGGGVRKFKKHPYVLHNICTAFYFAEICLLLARGQRGIEKYQAIENVVW